MSLVASPSEPSYRVGTAAWLARLPLRSPIAVIAAFVTLCVPLAYFQNIWQDEAYSLHSSSGTLAYALKQGLGFEAQAPLYFVILSAWRKLNDTATFARLLSIGFSIITLSAAWSFARRYIAKINPNLVVGAVAVNPFTIWAAVEIRPYAASIMFSSLLMLLFFRGYIDEKRPSLYQLAYVAFAIAGTYTQYYVAFIVPAHVVALLYLRRWSSLKYLLLAGIVIGVSLLPLARILPDQLDSYHAFAEAYKIPSYVMATVLLAYPFPHSWIASWVHNPAQNAAYLLISVTPLALGFRQFRRLSATTKTLVTIAIALFAMYVVAIAVAHVHVIIPRHTLVMLVPMLLAAFALIDDIQPGRRGLVLRAYIAVYGAFALLSFLHDYHSMTKIGDWRRVADLVDRRWHPGDVVALFNAEAELPFRYYFKRAAPIEAIPHAMSYERFDENAFVLHSTAEVSQTFGRFAAGREHVWLIETDACAPHYAFFGCFYLNKYVALHFRIVKSFQFDGASVLELRPAPALQATH